MIGSAQIRGARAMLRWTVADLAKRAKVVPNTVVRIEAGSAGSNASTVAAIERVLSEGGLEFIGDSGVRLKAQVAPLGHPSGGGISGPARKSRG